jgi:hypothetical protein
MIAGRIARSSGATRNGFNPARTDSRVFLGADGIHHFYLSGLVQEQHQDLAGDTNLRPDKPFPPAQVNGRGIGYNPRSGDRAGSRYDTLTTLFCYTFCAAPLGQHSGILTTLFCYTFCIAPLGRHSNILPNLLCDTFCAAPL